MYFGMIYSIKFSVLCKNYHKQNVLLVISLDVYCTLRWRSKGGHAPRVAGLEGISTHFLQSFKNAF